MSSHIKKFIILLYVCRNMSTHTYLILCIRNIQHINNTHAKLKHYLSKSKSDSRSKGKQTVKLSAKQKLLNYTNKFRHKCVSNGTVFNLCSNTDQERETVGKKNVKECKKYWSVFFP